ncbi:hypothetical protein [Butyrivibrio proteoclasticus]|uniref:hypothetical protein n=1 Tax=Butyrivibrio proteoclasticus TaxID=43305 RepID=UPI00047C8280|nr:hypothetical protein [Butyrivibrio proteoclasticus]
MDLSISFYLEAVHNRLKGINTRFEEGGILFRPFNEEFNLDIDFSDTYFSRLRNKVKDVDGAIRDAIQRQEVIESFEKHFRKEIVPLLNPHTGLDFPKELYEAIRSSASISERQKQNYLNLYESDEIALFLAHSFMYCLSTDNRPRADSTISNADRQYLDLKGEFSTLKSLIQKEQMNCPTGISLEMNDKYNISLTAKNPKDAFRIRIKVAKCSLLEEYPDFKSLLNQLAFSGEQIDFQICSFDVIDSNNRYIKHVENSLYTGETYTLPDFFVMKYDDSEVTSCPGKLIIKVDGNNIPLQLKNEYDEILLPTYNYRIERRKSGNEVIASFISDDDEHLAISLTLTIADGKITEKSVRTDFAISVKNEKSVLDRIQYYMLLSRMKEAKTLTFYKHSEQGTSLFISTNGFFDDNKKQFETIENQLELLKRIRRLELYFNVSFDISEPTIGDEYCVEVLTNLIDKGIAIINNQTVNTRFESEEDVLQLKEQAKSNPVIKHYSNFCDIDLFQTKITFEDRYNIIWVSEKIKYYKKKIAAYADTAVIYDSNKHTEDEVNIILEKAI